MSDSRLEFSSTDKQNRDGTLRVAGEIYVHRWRPPWNRHSTWVFKNYGTRKAPPPFHGGRDVVVGGGAELDIPKHIHHSTLQTNHIRLRFFFFWNGFCVIFRQKFSTTTSAHTCPHIFIFNRLGFTFTVCATAITRGVRDGECGGGGRR